VLVFLRFLPCLNKERMFVLYKRPMNFVKSQSRVPTEFFLNPNFSVEKLALGDDDPDPYGQDRHG
jgi:hypothetical protein